MIIFYFVIIYIEVYYSSFLQIKIFYNIWKDEKLQQSQFEKLIQAFTEKNVVNKRKSTLNKKIERDVERESKHAKNNDKEAKESDIVYKADG